jgi:hypothetical protein
MGPASLPSAFPYPSVGASPRQSQPPTPPTQQSFLQPTLQPASQPTPEPARKAPLAKRWWFWAVSVPATAAAVLGVWLVAHSDGGQAEVAAGLTAAASDIKVEADQGTRPDGANVEAAGRDNAAALKASLAPGSYTVGVEIQPGHYVITANTDDTGNLRIESPNHPLKCNELLGEGEFGIGATSYTTDLELGDLVYWQGVSALILTPAATDPATRLTPGNWMVGVDIPAGDYLATPSGEWSGNLRVYSSGGDAIVNEVVEGGSAQPNPAPLPVTLTEGDRVDVSGVAWFTFEPA